MAPPSMQADPIVDNRFSGSEVERVLSELDQEVDRRGVYIADRQARIDSLKQRRAATTESRRWFEETMKIAKGYTGFQNDSAISYYTQGLNRASAEGADSLVNEFRIRRATYLSSGGFIHDAIKEIQLVDTTSFGRGLKCTYYSSVRQMCSYIGSYYEGFMDDHDKWNNLAIEAQRRLLPLLDPKSVDYKLNLGEYYFSIREYSRSSQVLGELLTTLDPESSAYAITCHILASIAQARGNHNERVYYLALSAIHDLRAATREVLSLQELGGILFRDGNTDRAHEYLTAAIENVVESRAAVRIAQTTDLLTVVENDHNRQIARWRSMTIVIICFLFVCLIALVVTILYLRRQLARVALMKQRLETANRTKDVYISQFLTLSSIFMDKLKEFCKLVNRKISAGQTDELFKITKSPKFIEEQSKEFYSVFDDAFLHIYPDFVEKVNALLHPNERITLHEGELLNSDLRILAFMRLGIDDSNRIAKTLNYSVNTIYAYRNKLRNRAINRDTFEADIMKI